MEPKDTIKAMEIHLNRGECSDCAYSVLPMDQCQKQMFKDAIALINSLQAENDELKKLLNK